jgi:hypothetical protein
VRPPVRHRYNQKPASDQQRRALAVNLAADFLAVDLAVNEAKIGSNQANVGHLSDPLAASKTHIKKGFAAEDRTLPIELRGPTHDAI